MTVDFDKRKKVAFEKLVEVAQSAPVDLGDVAFQITLDVDISYSMTGRWPNEVQEAAERLLALVLTGLDDDGSVPFEAFHHGIAGNDVLTEDNRVGFVANWFQKHPQMGGTNYAPFIDKLLGGGGKKRFGKLSGGPNLEAEKDAPPFLHYIITDGAPGDQRQAEEKIVAARTRPHFFHFIVLGHDDGAADYINHLDKHLTNPEDGCRFCQHHRHPQPLPGIDNVGATYYAQTPPGDDGVYYTGTTTEVLHEWLPRARKEGITRK